MIEGFPQIARDVSKAWEGYEALDFARNAVDMRDGWEGFVQSFRSGVKRLISVGLKHQKSKPWAYRLKNDFDRNDEGLVYLREARNATEYGLTPSADYQHASVSIPGFGEIGGNADMDLSGSVFVDDSEALAFGDGARIKLKHGYLDTVTGLSVGAIVQNPASIRLKDIYSEEKKKLFHVPKSLAGTRLELCSPSELAYLGVTFLNTKFIELQAILR